MNRPHVHQIVTVMCAVLSLPAVATAQAADAHKLLDQVRRLSAAGERLAAARDLRAADSRAAVIDDDVVRVGFQAEITALAAELDPLFGRRRELERRHADRFAEHVRRLVKVGLPRTAQFVTRDVVGLDVAMAAELQQHALDAIATQVAGSDEARRDETAAALLPLAQETREFEERCRKFDSELPRWIELRRDVAEDLGKLAKAYRKQRELEFAFEVAAQGYELHRGGIGELYGELRHERAEHRALLRYEQLAKPHMEDLRRGNRKLGGSKRWRFEKMVIEAPPPTDRASMLVSKRQLRGDYAIEVDLQFERMLGVMQVVLAWRADDDYVALEFERPGGPRSWLRIVHVKQTGRDVLAEKAARNTMRDFFAVRGEVAGTTVTVERGGTRCSAELPFSSEDGVSYGFVRPAVASKRKKGDDVPAVRIRNVVVTGS
ncbi:MAG: hypothetical protein KAI24_03955 [Planctomycetes bacterium]|nr:hypothetical protein [Planctomycetota bacterium]